MFNNRGGSKTDAMIKLVLILFVSLLSFSVGTYVGKQVSDSDHRRAQIEGDYSHGEKEAAHDEKDAHDTAGHADKLTDEDIASLEEEFVSKDKEKAEGKEESTEGHNAGREVASTEENPSGYKKFDKHGKAEPEHGSPAKPAAEHGAPGKPAPEHGAEPKKEAAHAPEHGAPAKPVAEHGAPAKPMAEHEETPAKPVAHGAVPPAAQRVAEGHAPAPTPKEERKPVSVLPAVAATAVGKYTVQVASYPTEDEAKKYAAELKGRGYSAFYIPAEVQGKNWYRVSVGLFTSSQAAGDYRKELQKDAKITTAIVQKIVR